MSTTKRAECPVCRRSIARYANGKLYYHGDHDGLCSGSGTRPRSRTVRQAVQGDPPWLADMAALRAALVRLLWNSVVDDAECTCEDDDVDGRQDTCPECEAMTALGLGRWLGAKDAKKRLKGAV